jgi:hypothetical protein
VKGKMHRLPMTGVIDWNTHAPMDLFVIDVIGPMKTTSIGGHRYVLLIMDVHTRMLFIFVLKNKSDSLNIIINTIKQCQTYTGLILKHVHSDGAKDLLMNNEMKEFVASNGTRLSITTSHTPQHNAIIERMGRTVVEMAKSMIHHCNAYRPLWSEVFKMVGYIIRRCITSGNPNETPHQLWYKIKPSVNYLHVFGCDVYYHIHKSKRSEKLDANASKGIFVGYDDNNDTYYKIYDTQTNQIVVSRDVQFYENKFDEMKKLNEYQQQSDAQKIMNEHIGESDWLPDEYFNNDESVSTLSFPVTNNNNNNNVDAMKTNNTTKNNESNGSNELKKNNNNNTVPVPSRIVIDSNKSNTMPITEVNNSDNENTSIVIESENNNDRRVHVTLRGSNEENNESSNDISNNIPTRKRSQRNMNTDDDEYIDVHEENKNNNENDSVKDSVASNNENTRKSSRERKVRRLVDYDYDYTNATIDISNTNIINNSNEPTTYDEAIQCISNRRKRNSTA